jgi:nanoRNase/pAp phosphatase (c-di-AMP/oligoRNAs hydrolase)
MKSGADGDLRALLETLHPKARDDLRRVLIHDQADRDAVSSQLLRYRDGLATTGPTSSTC